MKRDEQALALAALRAAIAASGLSASQFARDILWREPRTLRRWLAGESPIPEAVRVKMEMPMFGDDS